MNSSKNHYLTLMIPILSYLLLSIPLVIAPSTIQETNMYTSLEEKILDIIEIIKGLGLSKGRETSLISSLENAIDALRHGTDDAAVNMLNAFINYVQAQRGKGLSVEVADELIAEAQMVINNIPAPDIEWIKLFDSNLLPPFEFDSGQSVVQTLDGGYVVTGYTHLGPQDGPRPYLNIWLIKTDLLGVEEWNTVFGSGSRYDRAFSIIQTSDGGYTIAGEFFNEGWGDAALIKTSSIGVEEWSQYYGSNIQGYVENAKDVIQTNDMGYIFAGTSIDYIGSLGSRIWLVKTNHLGTMTWEKTLANGVGTSVQQTLDNGFIVSGYSDTGMLLIKTDSSGNIIWEKTFGEPLDEGMDAIQTSEGGYLLAGSKLIKTDSDGNLIWESDYEGQSVKETSDGGYILSTLIKVDSNGILEWEISDFDGFDVELTNDGGCIITGEWEGDVLLVKIVNFQ